VSLVGNAFADAAEPPPWS